MSACIAASEYRERPWKNGGGLTREIAASFLDDDSGALLWSVSIATIERDGPFSDYRGYDRTIVAIDGDPVDLDLDGEIVRLRPGEPHTFAGEARVRARLTGGAARDLNVITRRAQFVHDLAIVTSTARFVLDEDEIAFIVALDGAVTVGNLSCRSGDTIAAQAGASFSVLPAASVAVIRITPL